MLDEEIKNKLSEKREYDLYLFKEVLNLYLNLLLYPNSKDKRILLMIFLNDNVWYSKLEREILKEIKKQNNKSTLEICQYMMDRMEKVFFNLFNYNEWILEGFSDAIETGEFTRASLPDKEFDILGIEDKDQFVKELKKYRN